MGIKETVRAQFLKDFGGVINTTGKEFCALVTNEKFTGTLETALRKASEYGAEYTDNPSIYNQTGSMLEKSVKFFTYLEQFTNETEKSLKNRIAAIFYRNGDCSWGTPRNIIKVFRQYFNVETIYLIENTNEPDANKIVNGDFANTNGWTFTNCERTEESRFSKHYGVTLASNSKLKQTVSCNASTPYYLHFFVKGNIGVNVKSNSGKYWNFETSAWEDDSCINEFAADDWKNISMFIINDSYTTSLTITFSGNTNCFVDYIRLNEKLCYPTFTVVAQFEGDAAKDALTLAPGTDDPIAGNNEDMYGYYNDTYLTGVATGFASDIYEDLLDVLRPSGVKAFIEIVNKDYIE